MANDELIINEFSNSLGFKNFVIKDINRVEDYLFIILDNGQKILTNGEYLYDVSEYDQFINIFTMGDRLCAVFRLDHYIIKVVDLNKMEVLFDDYKAYLVSKEDERTLGVIMNNGEKKTIYDIETKKYLPKPQDYEFEHSLGNNLYVFRESNSKEGFHNYKRCIINADGKFILKDIEGWIDYYDNHLIITKKDELWIAEVNSDYTLNIQKIKQNDKIIAKPEYDDGKIILIEKGAVKIYNLYFQLIKEFKIPDLNQVNDYELIEDTLKIAVPNIVNGEDIGKHLFLNLKTGKTISHLRIEGYPYWSPTTFVGQDSFMSDGEVNFHFYNASFTPILDINANYYDSVECNKECMFMIETTQNSVTKKHLFNAETLVIKEVDYDYVHFHSSEPYGYGVNLSSGKMQFFDENLNIIIPNFPYRKFDINYQKFSYFIVNDYVCVIKHIADGPRSYFRYIIEKANEEIILDSLEYRCYPLGDLIHILGENDSKFLNTLTGEINNLSIGAPLDENGNIDFQSVKIINNLLIGNKQVKKLIK